MRSSTSISISGWPSGGVDGGAGGWGGWGGGAADSATIWKRTEWLSEKQWMIIWNDLKEHQRSQTIPLIDPCASTLPLEKTKVVDSQTEQGDLQTELSPQVTFFWAAFTSKSRAVMFGPEGSDYDYLKPTYLIFIFIFHHIFILQPIQSTCLVVVCCAVAAAARIRELKTADLLGTKSL